MLSFIELNKPHIDLELYGSDTNIAPIDKVHIMDEDSFEQFTLEWLFGCKKAKYSSIKRIGGAGDKGRDVVGYYSDGAVDYYQCKHYNTGLSPTNYYLELGKLCYYTYKGEIPVPKEYFIIASNDVGSSLQDLIDNPPKLLDSLIKNWDAYCKSKITKTEEVLLDKPLLDYINSFDFTIIKTYPIAQIVDEYLDTIYGNIRFGGRRLNLPAPLKPTDTIEPVEMPYISALLEAYSDELKVKIDTTKSLEAYSNYFKHLNIEIRDCVRRLIEYQTEDYPEEMIRTEQENLNRLYDSYTEKYGLINSRGNYLAFASDESYFLLCSLEVLDDEGNFKRKADMFTKRTIKPHREVTSVETSSEALALSIGEKARVDLPYMEQLTGKTQDELVKDLHGIIFKVPNSEPVSYAAADEYLSGNVRTKLLIAQAAAKDDPELAVNVEALKQVIPKDLSAAEISVRLGTTWIPQEDIQQFVMELLTPSQYARGKIKVRYTEFNGGWFIENKSSDFDNVKANSTYGTKRASAYRIIEDTLNLRDVRIFDYVYDEHGNKKAVFNAKETTAAQAKQEAIKQAFADWIWKDPERRNRLVRYYNDTFNCIRPREYDGSHITFGGISPEITLRPHQVNAIAHILYGGNTLLAHKVGAGKTFEMVAAAQESKRLGLCQKSMFVVPNHLVGQWASEYLRLYPSANILVTTKQDFETGNRKKFCGRIATGDYDAVIIGHSQFEKIPMSVERQKMQLEKQLFDIERGIEDVQASKGEQFTVKQLMKTRKGIKAKLDKLNDTKRKDISPSFLLCDHYTPWS